MLCIKCKKELPEGSKFCLACGKRQAQAPRKTLKRANGMGTVYRLTAPRLRRPWVASKSRVVIGYYATKTEALQALEGFSRRDISVRFNLTFAEAYLEWSLEHFRTVGEKGKEAYRNAYENHATELYNMRLREIRTLDYQSAIDKMHRAERSSSAMEKLKQLFGQLSRWAVREEISTTDFAQFIKIPQMEKVEKQTFSEEDIETLLRNEEDSTVKIILILVYTGMRIGELFTVPKANVRVQEGYMVGGEKTKAGRNRIIAFPDCILPYVEELHRNAPDGGKLIDGYASDRDIHNFRKRQYYPTLERLGIRKLNPHCTRHTFITRAVGQGIDMDALLRIVGHVDKDTTQLYLHENAEAIRGLVKSLK